MSTGYHKTNQVLITVGTTKFDELIKNIDSNDFYNELEKQEVKKLIIQKGNGDYTPINYKHCKLNSLVVEVYEYLDGFEKIIQQSDVVVSHCGAGTALETLKHKKVFIATVNTKLMDNHQTELAEQLANEGYIYYADTPYIKDLILKFVNGKCDKLNPYPEFNYDTIPNIIYEMIGV